ncbi:unnamed protein product [Agarophyton chilense]
MGRCGTCRSHTQHFCFVHQAFVCDTCLVANESVHTRCVVRTYRNFIEDSSYVWPPVCSACANPLDVDGDNVRRTCLHVEHAVCIENSKPPDHKCPACQAPLLDNQSASQIAHVLSIRLRNMLTSTRSSAPTITTASSWDDSDKRNQSQSRNVINLRLQQRVEQQLSLGDHTKSETTSKIVSETDCSDGIGSHGLRQAKSNAEGTPSRVSMAKPSHPPPPTQTNSDELRLDMELLPQKKDANPTSVKSTKRDVHSGRLMTSTSMRKVMKLSNRRLIELRKLISTNKRQLLTLVACLACILVVSLLMSGEEGMEVSSKPALEQVSLPHVRVNPAFIQRRNSDSFEERAKRV